MDNKTQKSYIVDCENCRFGIKEKKIQWIWGYCEALDTDTIIDVSYLPPCDGEMFEPKEEEEEEKEEEIEYED